MGLDEHEGRVVLGGQRHGGGDALGGIHILELVKQRLALNLGIHTPLLDSIGRHTGSKKLGTEGVLGQVSLQPVHALSKGLEGGCGSMHTVVASVGDLGKSKSLP